MKPLSNQLTILALVAMALLTSCKKEEDIVTKNSDNKVTEQTIAPAMVVSSTIDDVMDLTAMLANPDGSFKTDDLAGAYSCAVKTVDSSSELYIYTFDFGSGCTSPDGVYRSGKVTVAYNGIRMITDGSVATITFDNFNDGTAVTNGTFTIANVGLSANNNIRFSLQMNVTRNIEYFINSSVNVQTDPIAYCEWVAGFNTSNTDDDQFSITGIFAGTDNTGEGYQVDVLTDLIKIRDKNCTPHFVSGVYRYKHTVLPISIVDFGSGQCDNLATVTTNGVSQTITLN